MREITLYFTQGSSDKIYQVRIFKEGNGFTVTYANAKRGQALNHKKKCQTPIDLKDAEKLFEKTYKSKVKTGYTTNIEGVPYSGVEIEGDNFDAGDFSVLNVEHSGISCQLLNEITETEAIKLCSDDRYVAQQKHDGNHLLIKRSEDVRGINKKGFYTALTPVISDSALNIDADSFIIDGEDMGHTLWAFDLLELKGVNIAEKPYIERYQILSSLVNSEGAIKLVETAFTTQDKLDLFERIKTKDLEGIVFKRVDEIYNAGKGGDQYKFKFFDEVSVIVTSISKTKRSVGISVVDGNKYLPIGNVTIPSNKDIPTIQDVIEVKYLHCFVGGSLYMPSYLKPRNDVNHSECQINRIKFKPVSQVA
ncbi:MAG: hypothetical protein QM500_19955 [Methylococcales bacterium]